MDNFLLGQNILKNGFKKTTSKEIKKHLGFYEFREKQENMAIERLREKHGNIKNITRHYHLVKAQKEITVTNGFMNLSSNKKYVTVSEPWFDMSICQGTLNLYCENIIPEKQLDMIEKAKKSGMNKFIVRYGRFENKIIKSIIIGYINSYDEDDTEIEDESNNEITKCITDKEVEDYIEEDYIENEIYLFWIDSWKP